MAFFLFAVKQGIPTDEEVAELCNKIAGEWMRLGRRLGINNPKLEEIQETHYQLSERGYQMLKHWKQEKGSAATYQALCDALKHELVQRKDLAEEFCYIHYGNYLLRGEGTCRGLPYEWDGDARSLGFT